MDLTASSKGHSAPAPGLPQSDVSVGVGYAGLLGLFAWLLFCRTYPVTADFFNLPGPHERLSGPYAALMAVLFSAGPMAIWSVLVDKVHRNPSTGIDWSRVRPVREVLDTSVTKIAGLWATWAILAGLYCLFRWYWMGNYIFAMDVLKVAGAAMFVFSVPYVIWLDRHLLEPRDHAWHFGAMLIGREAWDTEEVKKHWRAWGIKAFFSAFMLSILPGGWAFIVEAKPAEILTNPALLCGLLISILYLIDVQIGTAGYIFTLRPLDAHIRSGNPFLAGWLAALLCYPPLSGINQIEGWRVFDYKQFTADWSFWLADYTTLMWVWGAWLIFLTAIYAWATFAFGLRFSNLTYRGVITNGPYRYTRHPAYLTKNLYWWFSGLPFLVTNGSETEMIRNCAFLLCYNAIYYWRARTEEAHLLAEDPKYREYHAWMGEHGLITSRLSRLTRAIKRQRGSGRLTTEPAE